MRLCIRFTLTHIISSIFYFILCCVFWRNEYMFHGENGFSCAGMERATWFIVVVVGRSFSSSFFAAAAAVDVAAAATVTAVAVAQSHCYWLICVFVLFLPEQQLCTRSRSIHAKKDIETY